MALTQQQIEARRGKLTASRVGALMRGNEEEIYTLWQEMTGQIEAPDLSDIWVVRVGEFLEPLNLLWYEKKIGPLSRKGEVVVHPKHSWAACTLDAWCDLNERPVEAKYHGGDDDVDTIVLNYGAQLQWQMEVTGASEAAISIIIGRMRQPPIVEVRERDEEYAAEMIKRGDQFMNYHVANRIPPVELEPVAPPVERGRIYDFSDKNSWCSEAFVWLETKQSAERCKIAEQALKSMVPEDAKKVHGAGIQVTVDRGGKKALRQAIDQDEIFKRTGAVI